MDRPFVTNALLAQLRPTIESGYASLREMQEPPVVVTFRRRDVTTGQFTDIVVTNIQPVSIEMANQQPEETPAELRLKGVMEIHVNDIAPLGTPVIRQEDRFVWQGHTCRVDMVYPEDMWLIPVDFTLLEGN